MGRRGLRPPGKCADRPSHAPTSRAKAARSSTIRASLTPGDVSTIDQYGYMNITDRSKDVIKSGGEWISSIDLENLAVGAPGGGGGGGDRRRPSEMGRASAPDLRAQGRHASATEGGHPFEYHGPARSPNGGCPTTSPLHRRDPAHGDRQDLEAHPARNSSRTTSCRHRRPRSERRRDPRVLHRHRRRRYRATIIALWEKCGLTRPHNDPQTRHRLRPLEGPTSDGAGRAPRTAGSWPA